MRKTHLMLISLLIGLICMTPHAAAGTSGLIQDVVGALQRIHDLLETLRNDWPEQGSTTDEVALLQPLLTNFQGGDLLLTERFRRQGEQVAVVGGVAAERHQAFIERSRQSASDLLVRLGELGDPETATPAALTRSG